MTLIGQFRASYLLCQSGDDLVIIDQHAAHERMLFEEFSAAAASGKVLAQELLFPAVVELDARQAATLEGSAGLLAEAGFIAEPFGPRTAAVRALPPGTPEAEAAGLLRDALDSLAEGAGTVLGERRRAVLALLACKAAVKAGQVLGGAEAQALVSRLSALGLPYCPHGRPIMRRISLSEMARLFKRT
ncbi:MAG: hypothetical protein V2A77_07900 [Pseudomonadota bacterium]